MPDQNFQGSVAGGVTGSAGVSSWGQAAWSCLERRWSKGGGPKMMLSPHTHTSGDRGSPEDHRTSCLFHKIKGMGKSPTGSQPLPCRKREETGTLHWRRGSAISPTRGLCGMWALLPCQTPCNTSTEAASRYQLGLPVFAVGASSSPCWDAVRDTLGFPVEHVFFG